MQKKLLSPSALVIALLAIVYGLSVVYQFRAENNLDPEGTAVIRISHSRLEPGYTEALDAVIADFIELKARQGVTVDVQQLSISGGIYEPWLNTQLVGGIAPDIVEQPESKYRLAGFYYTTYFYDLDELSARPNPYNDFDALREQVGDLDINRNVPEMAAADNPELAEPFTVSEAIDEIDPAMRALLAKQSHRDTYTDGMLGGYNFSAAHYYRYTISASQRRILYNKNLIEKAIGQPDPPQTLEAFLDLCARLADMEAPDGRPLIPIAANNQTPKAVFHEVYFVPFTWAQSYRVGNHYMHGISRGHFEEYLFGAWDMLDPAIVEFYELAKTLSRYMTPGYQSLDRSSSSFDFIQQRAAMRVTDIEEASSLFLQADFPVGVVDFPMPAPGERWYERAPYPMREYNRASGQFSLCKQSEHPDLALEFMQFWTSRIWNERFNRFANLVPVIKSAMPTERLEPFLVRDTGVMGLPTQIQLRRLDYPAQIAQRGEEWRFLAGEIDYETYAENVDKIYRDPQIGVPRVVALKWDSEWRLAKRADQHIAVAAARDLLLPPPEKTNRDAVNYMIFRSVIYSNGTMVRYSWDRDFYGADQLPPFPEF